MSAIAKEIGAGVLDVVLALFVSGVCGFAVAYVVFRILM